MFLVALCLVSGCYPAEDKPTLEKAPIDKRVEVFLGRESTIELLRSADEVTAFRMGRHKTQDGELFHGYAVMSPAVNVEPRIVERLVRILIDGESYFWDAGKACKFDPGVGMRFRKEDSEVDLVFCFTCDQLLIVAGKHKRMEDTDPARGALLEIMKDIFPHDDLIQKIR